MFLSNPIQSEAHFFFVKAVFDKLNFKLLALTGIYSSPTLKSVGERVGKLPEINENLPLKCTCSDF